MTNWKTDELALLWRHTNEQVSELTGRSVEEVGDMRLKANMERMASMYGEISATVQRFSCFPAVRSTQ